MMNFSVTRQSYNHLLRNLSIVYSLSFVFKSLLLLLFRLKFITVQCFVFSWIFLVQLTYYWISLFHNIKGGTITKFLLKEHLIDNFKDGHLIKFGCSIETVRFTLRFMQIWFAPIVTLSMWILIRIRQF